MTRPVRLGPEYQVTVALPRSDVAREQLACAWPFTVSRPEAILDWRPLGDVQLSRFALPRAEILRGVLVTAGEKVMR
ncbi:hypothetical protein JQK87_04850 [Streptomyces sp. G44]|uniref:hypothetical protein n=1 Tax=Streptomyces sp. G44 TaxID=2807632 RepID=UPI00196069E6|nr:hypothetical protein [Streptomyces sp. G44]MBM7167747.1 hypothetical protein [Streptomyces sp. G44]